MNSEKLLSKLNAVETIADLNKIKEELENEIRVENAGKTPAEKSCVKEMIRFCKKAAKNNPILEFSGVTSYSGFKTYCACDSHIAIETETSILPIVPDGQTYPDIKRILNSNDGDDVLKIPTLADCKVARALGKESVIKLETASRRGERCAYYFNPDYIKIVLGLYPGESVTWRIEKSGKDWGMLHIYDGSRALQAVVLSIALRTPEEYSKVPIYVIPDHN